MVYVILSFLVILCIYGPSIWVRYVLKKYSKPIDDMPGTGSELAAHLIERFELKDVKVQPAGPGENYYAPREKIVALSPEVYDGKSLTAVSVAAHEVGHAIQFCKEEPISKLREKYLGSAFVFKRIGLYILMAIPFITLFTKNPFILLVGGIIGVLTMLASVLMYVAILPEEYDASFKKALPILKEGYLPDQYIPAASRILKACALTYVAAALSDILNLWRWFRLIR